MDVIFRLVVMFAGAIVFLSVLHGLIHRKVSESNSVMWFAIGVIAFISGLFPDIIAWISNLLGVDYPPALLFLISTFVLMYIVFKHSAILSTMTAQVKELSVTLTIVKAENDGLRREIEALTGEKLSNKM